ncbi:choice-of-anchor Q domain-containing protein [Dokdonella immobilis]|uniref:choice-of-anchor Q domain-containing protein n=1 Tax=Dokdonella immobilis TaxID=578942 RepID=UPI001587D101|nr:choice-of-anchor Q domain-containing protein [Dokdonella immobilis]
MAIAFAAVTSVAHACPIPADTLLETGFEIRSGTVRYVATNGTDANTGSAQSPWRHLQYAADHVGAGDTVCVRGGIYNERLSITSGGSDAAGEIVFEAYPDEQPILDGTGLSIPGGQWGLVTLEDVNRVVVRGFELRNYTTASTAQVPIGLYVTGAGHGIRVIGNRIHDIRTTASGCAANAFGLKVDGTRLASSISELVIAGNEIDHLVLGCSESLSLDGNVEQWQIVGNTVHDTNNIGIGAIGFEGVAPDPGVDQARDGLIADNLVYAISSFGNPAYGNEYAADGIYVDGGTRIVIERNIVHHVDIGIEVASEHAGRTSSDVIVRSNLVYAGNSVGISIGGYSANVGGSERVTIVNNTLYDNDRADTFSGEFQIQYHATSNMFANNIVSASASGVLVNAFTGDTALPADMDRNLYFASGSTPAWIWKGVEYNTLAGYIAGSGEDASALSANPQFINTTTPDLRVLPASPAVGGGINLGMPIVGAHDVAGQARIQGSQIDIGAYEQ